MKKKLLISVLLLTFAWVSAQNTSKSPVQLNALQFEKTANYTAKKDLILLWDNTNINTLDGVVGGTSTYWSGNNNWAWIADDFDADGPWIIYKISSKGYYPEEPAIIPTKMTVVIYENNGGKPGAELYRNTGIPVENVLEPEIILPEPFALPAAGKYWITIAATFDRTVNNNAGVKYYRWYISRGTKQIGANYHYYDKLGVYAPTYSTATWVDASPITSLYSSYFKIEGDPGVEFDCQHVTNLTAEYDVLDCSKAEITWRAPAGKGDFSYIVYRDGEEMATVTTESYVDATLEPTLKHTWGVKVVCTGYTPVITVTKEACKEPDCPQMPKKFAVNVNQAECTATLTWQAPSEILWDNSKPTFDGGLLSYRFMKDYYNHTSVLADDFDVPSGETWYVTEVHCGGSYAPAGQPPFEIPDFIGIEIYDDLNNMPGTLLYYFPYLSLVGGMTSNSYVILPYPVKLLNGLKYWVSIAGIYDRTYSDNCGYAIYALAEERGLPVFQWKEKETGDEGWRPIEVMDWTGVSLNFRIQGKKYAEPVRYNIYRDGVLIESEVTELTYTDKEFDTHKGHTWSVKTICQDGNGESAPVIITLPAAECEHGGGGGGNSVLENKNSSFTLYPNPTTGNMTITSETIFNKVEVINFLGQTVLSRTNASKSISLDLSHLNNGIYFVRIASEKGANVKKFVKQ